MFGSRRRQMVALPLASAMVIGGLAGCGSAASPAASAPTATFNSRFSPGRLRGALLARVNGVMAKAPATSGDFSSLTGVGTGQGASAGGQVTPRACAGPAQTGLNAVALAGSLAAAVNFKVGSDDVRELLVALPGTGATARSALSTQFAAKCAHYTRVAGGKTVRYTVTESAVTGIGKQATVLNVRSSGGAADNQWSVSYRGTGFVGSVTVVGPNASRLAVKELSRQAYTFAAKSLG